MGKSYTELLVCSSKPELTWLHSASVGSLIEFLVITGFGVNMVSNLSTTSISSVSKDDMANREDDIGRIVTMLISRSFEMNYVICIHCESTFMKHYTDRITASLCSLVSLLKDGWWIKNPFIYLEIWKYIRSVMLQQVRPSHALSYTLLNNCRKLTGGVCSCPRL